MSRASSIARGASAALSALGVMAACGGAPTAPAGSMRSGALTPPAAASARPAAPATIAARAPRWAPVALTVGGPASIAITARVMTFGDELATRLDAAFMLDHDVTARGALPDGAELRTRLRCRVSGVNLHVPDELAFDDDFKLTGGRTALSRHVTSLREAPQACEVVFAYRATPRDDRERRDPSEEAVVATACLRAHGLADGPCPPATFPAPILPAGFTIGLTTLAHAFTEANGGGFLFDGGVSFLEAPRPDRDYALAFRCEDGARGEHDLGRLTSAWVQILPAGSTLALTGQLGGYPEPGPRSGRCELTFTSSKPPPDKRVRPQIHGTYCLAGGTGTPGPCAAPFKVPPAKPLDPAAGKYRMRR